MGIWDKIRGEFIDVIEWLDDSQDTIVYRFDRHNNEIKYGAKLTVRESQVAVFVDEGKLADVFQPGMYTLETSNLPILSTLRGWKYGFQSPFKAEVYFVNTKRFVDFKWGTKNPILMRDADFGMVRVRAFGTYAFRIVDAAKFLREVSGTDWHFTTDEISEQFRNVITARFAEAIGEAKVPVLDLAARYGEMGEWLRERIAPAFDELGVSLATMLVENVSVPPEVEAAIDLRSQRGAAGDLGEFLRFQAANALGEAAKNPGGASSIGAQMSAGMAMGQAMASGMTPPPTPPPVPSTAVFLVLDGQRHGPSTLDEVRSLISQGKVAAETLVWLEGMPEWKPAKEVPSVANLLPPTPPPIPG